jgi:hypothetical protein
VCFGMAYATEAFAEQAMDRFPAQRDLICFLLFYALSPSPVGVGVSPLNLLRFVIGTAS